MTFIKSFFAVLVPLLALDALWLAFAGKFFYQKYLGALMLKNPVWSAAVVFYIIYIIGVALFIVMPAVSQSLPWFQVLLRGALFGLVAYATYDLTNQATIAGWSLTVTIVDLVWGAVLTGVSSLLAYLILK